MIIIVDNIIDIYVHINICIIGMQNSCKYLSN